MEKTLVPDQSVASIPCQRALVFAPHPDDEVFGCGGAIMRHIEQGAAVRVIIVSDGAYGVSEDQTAAYISQRQQESIAAARILGYGSPVFWRYRDRQIRYDEKLIQEVSAVIRETDADLVYAPSVFEMHPDHRMLAMAVIEAVRRIGEHVLIALYEVGVPLHPNLLLDITGLMPRKNAAMECFVSQNAKQRYDLHIAALNRYRTYTLPAHVTAAEAFNLIPAEELTNDPLKLYRSEHSRQKALGLPLDSSDLPLVSVIIRSMDRDTLSDALDSVALQTYSNIEVVIVNAKGTEHRKVGAWCGRFPQHVINEEGVPLSRSQAGNAGLLTANGSYLLFLDDDDWLAANHVAKLVDTLITHPTHLAAHTGIACVNEKNQITLRIFEHPFDAVSLMVINSIPIHAVLFSRKLIVQGCLMDETLTYYEDWDFWLQISLITDFVFTPGVSGYYRIHSSSGVHHQEAFFGKAYLRIYDKWRSRWPSERLTKLMSAWWRMHLAQIQMEQELINIRAQLTQTQTQLTQTQTQLTQTQTQLATADAELNDVYHSRSWRITAPLRNINRIIRNLLNHS